MISHGWIRRTGCICALVLSCFKLGGQPSGKHDFPVSIPFVGCKSDGQTGPLDAPVGKARAVEIDSVDAQQLAYYQAENGPGVLAPRGWNCFGVYGSDGAGIYVTPQPINNEILFNPDWKRFDGPFIEVFSNEGDTSGRYVVAKTIARLFPSHFSFVRNVMKLMHEPPSEYPRGPFPTDKLTYKSREVVEYVTPPDSEGEGTQSRLQKNGDPIYGVAILMGSTPDLLVLNVRLSAASPLLAAVIIHQTEQEAIHEDQ
jgi:hypothetical protein